MIHDAKPSPKAVLIFFWLEIILPNVFAFVYVGDGMYSEVPALDNLAHLGPGLNTTWLYLTNHQPNSPERTKNQGVRTKFKISN